MRPEPLSRPWAPCDIAAIAPWSLDALDSRLSPYRFLHLRGHRLAYRTWGDESGEPVMLIHAFASQSGSWKDTAEALARHGFRVIAPDLRGHWSKRLDAHLCPAGFRARSERPARLPWTGRHQPDRPLAGWSSRPETGHPSAGAHPAAGHRSGARATARCRRCQRHRGRATWPRVEAITTSARRGPSAPVDAVAPV